MKPIKFDHTKAFRNLFEQAIKMRDSRFISESLHKVNAADIAALLQEFDSDEVKYALSLLDEHTQIAVIADMEKDIRADFLNSYPIKELSQIIPRLDSDDAVDTLNEMPAEQRENVLNSLNKKDQLWLMDLLPYDENVAGGIMAKELIKANIGWTVHQSIAEMRKQAKEVDKFYTVYVVDSHNKLLGTMPLHKLIFTAPETPLQDIYDAERIFVRTHQDEAEVVETMRRYDLETIPVVNTEDKLVGRITIDDIVDRISDRAEEERQMMSGISEDVEEHDGIWQLTRARLPWLLVGIMGGLISVQFISFFESDILRLTASAFFIPLIQATSGNVGIQSSSIIVQSLANPGFVRGQYRNRLFKVFAVAILNGLLLALVVWVINTAMGGEHQYLSMVVSMVLFVVVVLASFIGTVIPLVLDKFGLNPALASGPFITTINDLIGLGIYLLTIHLLL